MCSCLHVGSPFSNGVESVPGTAAQLFSQEVFEIHQMTNYFPLSSSSPSCFLKRQTLEELECHGPVGSEQSRAELEQKLDEARESLRKAEVRGTGCRFLALVSNRSTLCNSESIFLVSSLCLEDLGGDCLSACSSTLRSSDSPSLCVCVCVCLLVSEKKCC